MNRTVFLALLVVALGLPLYSPYLHERSRTHYDGYRFVLGDCMIDAFSKPGSVTLSLWWNCRVQSSYAMGRISGDARERAPAELPLANFYAHPLRDGSLFCYGHASSALLAPFAALLLLYGPFFFAAWARWRGMPVCCWRKKRRPVRPVCPRRRKTDPRPAPESR